MALLACVMCSQVLSRASASASLLVAIPESLALAAPTPLTGIVPGLSECDLDRPQGVLASDDAPPSEQGGGVPGSSSTHEEREESDDDQDKDDDFDDEAQTLGSARKPRSVPPDTAWFGPATPPDPFSLNHSHLEPRPPRRC